MRVAVVIVLLLAGIGACSSYGEEDPETPLPGRDMDGGDEGSSGSSGAPSTCPPPPCTLPQIGAPFAFALLDTRDNGCPEGWLPRNVVENPTAPNDACGCGSCVMAANCNNGPLPTKYGATAACGMTGITGDANNGQCRVTMGSFGDFALVTPPTATSTSCSAPGTADRAKVKADGRRVCTLAPDTCPATACGKGICAVAPGDVPCPVALPTKHLVGSDFALTCAGCACTTSVTCNGILMGYDNTTCSGTAAVSLPANTCVNANNFNFKALKWTGSIASQTCANVAPAKPAVALTDIATVCCL